MAPIGFGHRVQTGNRRESPEPVVRLPLKLSQNERQRRRAFADDPLVGRMHGQSRGSALDGVSRPTPLFGERTKLFLLPIAYGGYASRALLIERWVLL